MNASGEKFQMQRSVIRGIDQKSLSIGTSEGNVNQVITVHGCSQCLYSEGLSKLPSKDLHSTNPPCNSLKAKNSREIVQNENHDTATFNRVQSENSFDNPYIDCSSSSADSTELGSRGSHPQDIPHCMMPYHSKNFHFGEPRVLSHSEIKSKNKISQKNDPDDENKKYYEAKTPSSFEQERSKNCSNVYKVFSIYSKDKINKTAKYTRETLEDEKKSSSLKMTQSKTTNNKFTASCATMTIAEETETRDKDAITSKGSFKEIETLKSEDPIHNPEDPWFRPYTIPKSMRSSENVTQQNNEYALHTDHKKSPNDTSKCPLQENVEITYMQYARCSTTEELKKNSCGYFVCHRRDHCIVPSLDPNSEVRGENGLDFISTPNWCDSRFVLQRVTKGNGKRNVHALKLHAFFQESLFRFGCFVQRNSKLVLLVGVLLLVFCSVGLKQAYVETDITKLWIEDGGKLQEEMKYTREALSSGDESSALNGYSQQMLIQTANNTLDVDSLKLHLKAAIAVTKVAVAMYNQTWTFSDVCYKEALPIKAETAYMITSFFEKLSPCMIVGPLDCFWEGSKLLGPTAPLHLSSIIADVTWKNVNPLKLVDDIVNNFSPSFYFQRVLRDYRELMVQSGITTGYQEKWCLDPYDPECPKTAPNYKSKELPDIKALLRDGCSGYASKLMEWPVDLIVGGVKKDANNGNITQAQGLQTLFNLMSSSNMYEFHKTVRTGTEWNEERAQEILSAWQRSFVEKVYKIVESEKSNGNNANTLHAFSVATARDIIKEFSSISIYRMLGGYLLMMGYACLSLMRWKSTQSQGAVGIVGVLLLALSVAGGLGLSSVIGISFHAASTQVLPPLLLGLGVDGMFMMTHHFGEICLLSDIPLESRIGECLKRVGVSVFLASIAILSGFLFSLVVPMPALRAFGLQASIVSAFNLLSTLFLFPAVLSMDLSRRKNNNAKTNGVVTFTEHNVIQNTTCSHSPCYKSYVAHESSLPEIPQHFRSEERDVEATISTDKTPYCNESYVTVLGSPRYSMPYTTGYFTAVHHPEIHPNSPPPAYASNDENISQHHTSRPRVAFVHQPVVDANYSSALPNTIGRNQISDRRESCSIPPTNLTSPMEGLQSSTYNLVPPRKKARRSRHVGKRPSSCNACLRTFHSLTISQLGERYYAPFLLKNSVRIVVIVFFAALLVISIYGVTVVKDGLNFSDIFPRDTREFAAVVAQTKYFSFHNMYIITKSFDYASNQKNLDSLHQSVGSISYIMRKTNGTMTKYWLDYMRDWLQDLQNEFDNAWTSGDVNTSTWTPQASDKAVLAYKLLLQTGRADYPIERGNIGCKFPTNGSCKKVDRLRLVTGDKSRSIPEAPFYNYLSAWVGNDPLAYSASQARIHPCPKEWSFKRDLNMIIPRSPAIVYAQMPFYLNNLRENEDFVNVIKLVRGKTEAIESETSVSSFPSGYPFTFWQQYIDLRFWLFISIGCLIVALFLILSIVLCNPWAAFIMIIFLVMIVLELLGFMGAANVKLSAVPAAILVAAVGVGVEFTVHITYAFINSCGSRQERVKRSIGHMLGPVLDGSISTLLGIFMLAGSEFDFIVTYFFQTLTVLILLCIMNGLVLLPVILSFVGPHFEVVDCGDEACSKNTNSLICSKLVHCNSSTHLCLQRKVGIARSGNNKEKVTCLRSQRIGNDPFCNTNHSTTRDRNEICFQHSPSLRQIDLAVVPTEITCCYHADNFFANGCQKGCGKCQCSCMQKFHPVEAKHNGNPSSVWHSHPYAVPEANGTNDANCIFACPRAEHVTYARRVPLSRQMSSIEHCDSCNAIQGDHSKPHQQGTSQAPTLTAASSLTVKEHSGRQEEVVSSAITLQRLPHDHRRHPLSQESKVSISSPYFDKSPQRRFDIAALTGQKVTC